MAGVVYLRFRYRKVAGQALVQMDAGDKRTGDDAYEHHSVLRGVVDDRYFNALRRKLQGDEHVKFQKTEHIRESDC